MLITSGSDWTFEQIEQINEEIEIVARELGYDWYTNQIEIITTEQMMDCYSSIGVPLLYKHWSFGKDFLKTKKSYEEGRQGLAYEIVINSNPCIVFCMENNSLLMQALVCAHAGIGHNHFFKNNMLFKQWTNAGDIIQYLEFAKKFVETCEEKYGLDRVEEIIDIAHSLKGYNVFKYPRKEPISLKNEMARKINKALEDESEYNDLWTTIPKKEKNDIQTKDIVARRIKLGLPEENILFFLEQKASFLKPWQREILRIVRNIQQYFYPQGQTKIMNEGCATWTHYTILNKMYDKGLISDGAMLEFLKSHTGVIFQPEYWDPRYNGINPYAMGFAMMQDIVRICDEPDKEDIEWFPDFAGKGNHMEVLKYAWVNFRDESFIRQYLSPKVMRKFRLFSIINQTSEENFYTVKNIHNESGYKKLRTDYANLVSMDNQPEIEIVDCDLDSDRILKLEYVSQNSRRLHENDAELVLDNVGKLWGYEVQLTTVTPEKSYISRITKYGKNRIKVDD